MKKSELMALTLSQASDLVVFPITKAVVLKNTIINIDSEEV